MGIIKEIISQVHLYYGEAVFLIAAIVSYIYLMVKDKDVRRKFLYPVGLIIFCVINPVLYKFVFSKVIYWRLLWTFPDAIIIALAATKLLKSIKKVPCKLAFFAVCVAFAVCAGNNAYTNADYTTIENWYKIPSETKEVCDIILGIDDEPRCIMPEALYSDVRQYAGEIELLYGRNAIDEYILKSNEASKKIYLELRKEAPDYDYIFGMSCAKSCNFVVLESCVEEDIYVKYGYEQLAVSEQYYIYYNSEINQGEESGWLISQYGKVDDNRRTYITIQDGDGGLIIIDGGSQYNSYNIRQQIKSYGNHVTAWIITNPHKGYSEALHNIIEEYDEIVIDEIYTLSADTYDYQKFNKDVHYVEQGDTFEIKGLGFAVEYLAVDEKKDYAMMSISIEGNSDKTVLYTSLNKTEKKYLEEEMGITIPVFSTKLERRVFR